MRNAAGIFRFLLDCTDRGERTALVTVTDVIGSSVRSPGTHMAISESGASVGTLSGGCVEAAIVGEAVRLIAEERTELIRFGAGSRFIDIRLPCGGGIDLLIISQPCRAAIRGALARLDMRRQTALELGYDGSVRLIEGAEPQTPRAEAYVSYHRPDLKVFVIGHGAESAAMTRMALSFGAEVTVLSPDVDVVAAMGAAGATSHLLKTAERSPHLLTDPDSAVVFLFHDHDWEAAMLGQVLEQQPFFVGAMGSHGTHVRRLEVLRNLGVAESDLARVEGPIGLIPATRDPDTLALSVLAQIAERYHARPMAEIPWQLRPAA